MGAFRVQGQSTKIGIATVCAVVGIALITLLVPISKQSGVSEAEAKQAAETSYTQAANDIDSDEMRKLRSAPDSPDPMQGATRQSLAGDADRDSWEKKFRSKSSSPGRMFALAPLGVVVGDVVRNSVLNPSDQVLAAADIDELGQVFSSCQHQIRQCEHLRGAEQDRQMRLLLEQGSLRELSLGDLPAEKQSEVLEIARMQQRDGGGSGSQDQDQDLDMVVRGVLAAKASSFIPDAVAFICSGGKLYIATNEQLTEAKEERDHALLLKSEFFLTVLRWFERRVGLKAEVAEREMRVFASIADKRKR